MKRYGYGTRLLSLLLAIWMVVSLMPLSAYAAADEYDDTGLSSGINTSGTTSINWPIKIYDYLNDGMLFEFAQNGFTDVSDANGGAYGGDTPMPVTNIGVDYTLGDSYNKYSFKYWGNTTYYRVPYDDNATEVTRKIVAPVKDKSPMYLHLSYDYPVKDNTKSYVITNNFARDNSQYYSKDDVRYMVMVYRTNQTYYDMSNGVGHALRPFWAVSDSSWSADNSYHVNTLGRGGTDITDLSSNIGRNNEGLLVAKEQRVPPSTDKWGVFIMDMKSDHNTTYGISTNWDKIGDERVAGIGMSIPICAEGEEIDISHIAYFSSREECVQYGIDAVAFNNDPGEYLGNTYTASYSTTNGPAQQSLVSPGQPTISSDGSDFTGATSRTSWDAPFSSWHSNSASGTWMTANVGTDSKTDLHYMQVGSWDAGLDMMQFGEFGSGISAADNDYIVIVYKTENMTTTHTMGFSLNGDYGYVGYDEGDRAWTYLQSFSPSSTWTYTVYYLGNLENSDPGYWSNTNTIYDIWWYLPGLNTSEKIDIAYVEYCSSQSAADAFGASAVSYMKGETTSSGSSGSTGGTTTTTTAEKPAPTGNTLDFTISSGNKGTSAAGKTYLSGFDDYTYQLWSDADVTTLGYGGLITTPSSTSSGIPFVRVSDNDSYNDMLYTFLSYDTEATKASVNYVTIVYKTSGFTGNKDTSFWLDSFADSIAVNKHLGTYYNGIEYISDYYPGMVQTFYASEDQWTYMTFDLSQLSGDSDYASLSTIGGIGWYLPGLTGSEKLDIAMIDFYDTQSKADAFGQAAVKYMNGVVIESGGSGDSGDSDDSGSDESYIVLPSTGSVTTTVTLKSTDSRGWNLGDNSAFGMLYSSTGGKWLDDGVRGGSNSGPNGYYSYQIGKCVTPTSGNADGLRPSGLNNKIYLLNLSSNDTGGVYYSGASKQLSGTKSNDNFTNSWYYDMSCMTADGFDLGYTLHTYLVDGLATVGLVEPALQNGRLVYREATVDYIADLLNKTLNIPETDTSGNYNMTHIKGTPSTLYGDSEGESIDLATALRRCLNITFSSSSNTGTGGTLGTYAKTIAKVDDDGNSLLIGSFQDCKQYIDTFYDAAYYILNNLFVADSYNQAQHDYRYLTLSQASIDEDGDGDATNDKTAFVFDGGFTYTDANGNTISALDYNKDTQTIGLHYDSTDVDVLKDLVYYSGKSTTTRYPFLPVTDATGDFAGETRSEYFLDDGVRGLGKEGATYANRNYNFVMTSNGEFVYHEEDQLFFEFEGDDDVYLFINGQLVLDIGAGHSITKVKFNMNDYVEDARAKVKAGTATARDEALALTEGEICTFDFYYMERHGWGSNMRIVSNMRVTDPALHVDKMAEQNGESVNYGDVVEKEDPIHYNFKLSNTGNTKLYNLTFADKSIGVTLDYINGLSIVGEDTEDISDDYNGVYITDAQGGRLEAKDLVAYVDGYMRAETDEEKAKTTHAYDLTTETYIEVATGTGTHIYSPLTIRFKDDENTEADEANAALIGFLKTLEGEGLGTGELDAEKTQKGSGLWVDGTVTFTGIYYTLTADQAKAGVFDNVVEVSATTRSNPADTESETLTSKANHRVYVAGAPYYYQWAGHSVFVSEKKILDDATRASGITGNQMQEYQTFFNNVSNSGKGIDAYGVVFCDKYGNVLSSLDEVKYTEDKAKTTGYLVTYPDSGTHAFYLLMYLNGKDYTDLSKLSDGEYAIVRVTMYVTDVKDSVYVLDYGLRSEELGTNGILFKDDELFGSSGSTAAKLMGVTTTKPGMTVGSSFVNYLEADTVSGTDYNRIVFDDIWDLSLGNSIGVFGDDGSLDGYYRVNLGIPSTGKHIHYNSDTGHYSLVDPGTVKLHANVPSTWEKVYLYYWYDNGVSNGWPGTEMSHEGGTTYSLNIPDDVVHVIVSNGSEQTVDMTITPGVEGTIQLTEKNDSDGKWGYEYSNTVTSTTIHAQVPEGWTDVKLYYWIQNSNGSDNSLVGGWDNSPLMIEDSDGWFNYTIESSEINRVIVRGKVNGGDVQTVDLTVTPGKEAWIKVGSDAHGNVTNSSGQYYATVAHSQDSYTVYVKVPSNWGGNGVYLHYWHSDGTTVGVNFPGVKLTDEEGDGWYGINVTTDITNLLVTNGMDAGVEGSRQTVDLQVDECSEVWITVADTATEEVTRTDGTKWYKYKADLSYGQTLEKQGITFIPRDFMDSTYEMWMAITVHKVGEKPTAIGGSDNTSGIYTADVGKEVQMVKKVTVLPANVVYYEDDFPAINYQKSGSNTFTQVGEGSSNLNQSVDQTTNYGYDDAYANSDAAYSGGSMRKILLNSGSIPAAYFTFTGTGFEIIARTNAADAGTIIVSVYNASDVVNGVPKDGAKVVKKLPVITEYDNNADGNGDADNDAINQVPIIRIDGKDLNNSTNAAQTYTVIIKAAPAYDLSSWVDSDGDGVMEEGEFTKVNETYLYLDGIRVFNPLGTGDDIGNYIDTEEGASFEEIRDLLLAQTMVSVSHTPGSLTVSTGLTTWTETRNGAYSAAAVSGVNEYLTKGPNNEVYMYADGTTNAALVFYVDNVTTNGNIQIAARALDYGLYSGGSSTGMSAKIQYSTVNDDGVYAWTDLATVISGTEQYYTIPLEDCPTVNDKYQIAIRVVDPDTTDSAAAMVSFTALKFKGLNLSTLQTSTVNLEYSNDMLLDVDTGMAVDTASYPAFATISMLMSLDTPIVPVVDPTMSFTSANLSLAGDIGLNFYTDLDESLLADPETRMVFTYAGKTQTVYLADATQTENGIMFTCALWAVEMADTVTAQLYNTDGAVGESKDYSVKAYCDSVFACIQDDPDGAADYVAVEPLLKALLNYGAAAQVMFTDDTADQLANAALADVDKVLDSDYDYSAFAHTTTGSEDGIAVAGAGLVLDTTTAIRYYFTLTGDKSIDAYTFVVNGQVVAPTAGENGLYFVDLVGVTANNLDEMYVAQVGGLTISYSAMSYVRQVKRHCSDDAALTALADALYAYSQAAESYFA